MTTTTLQAPACPEPGIYPDVPEHEYHAWGAASNSRLSILRDKSPAHLRAQIDNPPSSTDDMALGSAIHLAVLQPDLFAATFTLAPQCDSITGKGNRCSNQAVAILGGAAVCGVHIKSASGERDPRRFLPESDWRACCGVRDAVRSHPGARAFFDHLEAVELSGVWIDVESGVRCKLRADALVPEFGTVLDLKTTRDAGRRGFEKSIYNFGYYRQAAHYRAGLAAHGRETGHHVIIAVEKEPPYAVALYRIQDDLVEAGRRELDQLLARYAECIESGEWPAYGDDVTDISIPAWGWNQLEG